MLTRTDCQSDCAYDLERLRNALLELYNACITSGTGLVDTIEGFERKATALRKAQEVLCDTISE